MINLELKIYQNITPIWLVWNTIFLIPIGSAPHMVSISQKTIWRSLFGFWLKMIWPSCECPQTNNIVTLDSWIWHDHGCWLQGTGYPSDLSEELFGPKSYLRSISRATVALELSCKVTSDSEIQRNYAHSDVCWYVFCHMLSYKKRDWCTLIRCGRLIFGIAK